MIDADRHDSERLRGFGDGQTARQTFAILELLLRLKRQMIKFPNKKEQCKCKVKSIPVFSCGLLQ